MEEVELVLFLMTEYVQDHLEHMHKENFTTEMVHEVSEMMKAQCDDICDEVLINALLLFPHGRISYTCPPMENITERIEKIRKKPQPVQRTPEWYEYRHKLITASSAYKALGTEAKIRELVKSKQGPFVIHQHTCVDGPMHWGVKYEPVSIQYYEHVYDTKVEEFGCVTHDVHTFLGASPDGINVKEGPLYGRMLEVKNPFTREINGIPKEEYWVQCQLQMEVCDLDACDFLETKFVEYESEEAFLADGTFQLTSDGNYKGIILQFFIEKVLYEYAPFQCTEDEYKIWEQEKMDGRTWVRTIYWKLDVVSCVLILRQPKWFELVVNKFTQVFQSLG
jgi:putative phage-type endonuclease